VNLLTRRRDAELAAMRFSQARHAFHVKTRSLRARISGSREAWIVGGGFASGALVGLLPLRRLGGALRVVASGVSFALRGPIATLFADAMANKQAGAPDAPTGDGPADH
jgi:hypothetical protein